MTTPTLPYPVTGFGGVRFSVLREDPDAALPDWTRPVEWAEHPVAGSSLTYRQRVHVGPRRATYRIVCETDADAEALLALLVAAEPQTLTLLDGTATVGGTYEFVHGRGVRRVAAVLLVAMEPGPRYVGGGSEWLATFELTA